MAPPQYDYFAQYESTWDARSMSSNPSTVEISLPSAESEEVSPFDDIYEAVPEPVVRSVLVLQDAPIERNIASERHSRFVERFDEEAMSERSLSQPPPLPPAFSLTSPSDSTIAFPPSTRYSSATTLVNPDAEDPFADSNSIATASTTSSDEVSVRDVQYLGRLHLTTRDSCEEKRIPQWPLRQKQKKGGKMKRVVKGVLGKVAKALVQLKV
ncbi:hypothetical protein PRZ48_010082 [Zasmidium cellare]|uniref:Uncharacterized protein n=1 Tax=Zasmidium cellare TaxID=395010 RepID=A0ABR0EDJ3_ZASCE|nr:hypothetical protein PRZ48_010082 [Zasmidium cellare]